MRAVRAARAALPARVPAVLPAARLAVFLCVEGVAPGFPVFAAAFVFVAVVFAFAAAAVFVVESPVACPANGCRRIRTESRLATHRNARPEISRLVAETLMSPLYAAFAPTQWVGTIRVTQKMALREIACPNREFVLPRNHDFAPAASSVTLVLCSRIKPSFTSPTNSRILVPCRPSNLLQENSNRIPT